MLLRGNSRHLRKKRLKLNLLKTEYLGVLSKLRPNIKPVRMLRQLMHRLRLINPTQLTPTTTSAVLCLPLLSGKSVGLRANPCHTPADCLLTELFFYSQRVSTHLRKPHISLPELTFNWLPSTWLLHAHWIPTGVHRYVHRSKWNSTGPTLRTESIYWELLPKLVLLSGSIPVRQILLKLLPCLW